MSQNTIVEGMKAQTVSRAEVPPAGGRWAGLLAELDRLPDGQAKRLRGTLSDASVKSLRSAARWRERAVHIRRRDKSTYVWLGGDVEGYAKYRSRGAE